ncbi:MAG TPA: class I SAM-dependent rRNA methyltransferase [Bacteroidales bacterium]|nr:class I SAM-dependent rRNA methyltransferase [Bacteroidales bacterium]
MQKPFKVLLKAGKDASLRRFHPWVFSGAIQKMPLGITDGTPVEVFDSSDQYLGAGVYQDATIAIRMLAFAPERPEITSKEFWYRKIARAYAWRESCGLTKAEGTNIYRLVNGEGDHLPGIIIDNYNGHLVVQVHATGMYPYFDQIAQALQNVYGAALKSISDKSRETLPDSFWEGRSFNGNVTGESGIIEVKEYGHRFLVDLEKGQKTGFFIDQRENRKLLEPFAHGRKILNTFCYSGGFSVYGLKGGATEVYSLDSSAKAIELARQNVELNFGVDPRHHLIQADALQYLRHSGDTYDIIILDPPAFAKHTHVKHNALQGYKRLNYEAIKHVLPGGLLFTFSCSQVIDMPLFRGAILAAAIEAGRPVRVVHQMGQPADHPVNVFHPEGEYLKGLILLID